MIGLILMQKLQIIQKNNVVKNGVCLDVDIAIYHHQISSHNSTLCHYMNHCTDLCPSTKRYKISVIF